MSMLRSSGVLLHITSLPSPYGIGDLGPGARRFVDFLSAAGQSCWQVLPLNPTDQACGNSPYSSNSAFAGNILLISPEVLLKDGFLSKGDLADAPSFPEDHCDYDAIVPYKIRLLDRAYANFKKSGRGRSEYEKFCLSNSNWLEDYAAFVVLKIKRFNWVPWSEWEADLRDRRPDRLNLVRGEYSGDIEREKFFQHLFYRQWHDLRKYANRKGIRLIGDIPIYVSYDSADVWEHSHLFKLGEDRRPAQVAGVPPDYFSKTGQLWGNPVYRWDVLRERGYDWWLQRLEHNLNLFDIVRIDHFRGFVGYWEVPAGEKTAVNGRWVKAPAEDFFAALKKKWPSLPLIAEDLGVITDDVRQVMDRFGFPGMKILLFAFGGELKDHPYLPHNYSDNCVVYTGTHDNNTIRGWYEHDASAHEKKNLNEYLGRQVSPETVSRELVKLALDSRARLAIFPMQDLLGLSSEARMNTPGRARGNWQWRLLPRQMDHGLEKTMRALTAACKRR